MTPKEIKNLSLSLPENLDTEVTSDKRILRIERLLRIERPQHDSSHNLSWNEETITQLHISPELIKILESGEIVYFPNYMETWRLID